MAASRVIASRMRCNVCRTNFPGSFASLAGVDISANGLLRSRASTRAFTTAPLRLSDALSGEESRQAEEELASPASRDATSASPNSNSQVAPVPWYLQVDAPQQPLDAATHPFAERQRIPALPEHPPPILADFLQHVSVELGIDDLALLDLRHLDPPPALGGNLLMLLGTARSEKHLHVSADKMCRWLRSEHKLSPHADGLLGRNELKLKLRRKARKARMLTHAGASEGSLAADDGIRTGWVCVNVGTVKAADSAPRPVMKTTGFVGFGGGLEGVNIVLQLFTEEKRAELDLETLWNGVLKTDRRRREASTPDEALDASQNPNGAVAADNDMATLPSQSSRNDPQAPLQARAYHTTGARQYGMRSGLSRARERPWADMWLRTRRVSMSTNSELVLEKAPPTLLELAKPDQKKQADELAKMLEQLHQMSEGEKLDALGNGPVKASEQLTPFLESFFSNIPEILDVVHYEAIMQLYLSALSINHPGYSIIAVHNLLEEMQDVGVRVPEHMFLAAIRAIISRESPGEFNKARSEHRNRIVFALLHAMKAHSYPVLTDEIIIMLHDSVSSLRNELNAQLQDPERVAEGVEYQRKVRHDLLHRIDMQALPLKRDTFAHMLQSYAILGDMEGMWHVWSSTALAMHSRSSEMYATALNGVAFTGSQVDCIQVLRDCLPQMEWEKPPVRLEGFVAEAAKRCLLVVEPDVDKVWESGARLGEWVKLWDDCMRAQKGGRNYGHYGSGRAWTDWADSDIAVAR